MHAHLDECTSVHRRESRCSHTGRSHSRSHTDRRSRTWLLPVRSLYIANSGLRLPLMPSLPLPLILILMQILILMLMLMLIGILILSLNRSLRWSLLQIWIWILQLILLIACRWIWGWKWIWIWIDQLGLSLPHFGVIEYSFSMNSDLVEKIQIILWELIH